MSCLTGRAHKGSRAFRALFHVGTLTGLSDRELLERYLVGAGEVSELAFAAIVERHGPRVLRVCRGLLPNRDDAEDAFQATFLVLVRGARSIRKRDSIASWLHGVAVRVAKASRASALRRKRHEVRRVEGASDRTSREKPEEAEVRRIVHEELDNLPERLRAPIVLCDLDGLTHEGAADRLEWPVGTVKSRLARGRARLRGKLERRGLGCSGVVLGGKLRTPATSSILVRSTASAASEFGAGRAVGGMVRATVNPLVQGVLKMIRFQRWMRGAAALFVLSAAVAGGVVLAQQALPPLPPTAPDEFGGQCAFEVRALRMGSLDWRGTFDARMKLVSQEGGTTVWLIEDPKAEKDLLEFAQSRQDCNVLQFPKPTTFEGATATLDGGETVHYVSSLERLRGPDGGLAFKPKVRGVKVGWEIGLSARRAGESLKVKADVQYTKLLGMTTAAIPFGDKAKDGATLNGQIQIPDVKKTRVTADVPVPRDGVLLLSTGTVVRSRGMLGFNATTGEDLVMIHPRLISDIVARTPARLPTPRAN